MPELRAHEAHSVGVLPMLGRAQCAPRMRVCGCSCRGSTAQRPAAPRAAPHYAPRLSSAQIADMISAMRQTPFTRCCVFSVETRAAPHPAH